MKNVVIVGTGLAFLAMAQAAHAAPPKVSGKYVLMSLTQCEARFTTTGTAPVQSVNSSQSGEMNMGVGTLTFPAVAASSGNGSLELVIISGGSLRVNNSGNAVSGHTEAVAGTFAFSNTAFAFDPAGADPIMSFAMRFGDVVAGVARTLYLVRRENAQCVNSITATKQ